MGGVRHRIPLRNHRNALWSQLDWCVIDNFESIHFLNNHLSCSGSQETHLSESCTLDSLSQTHKDRQPLACTSYTAIVSLIRLSSTEEGGAQMDCLRVSILC